MTRRKRRGRRWPEADAEPMVDGDDVEWRGDPLIVAGRTPAGFAYGAPVAEMRRDNERTARGAGWARARRALHELLEREVGEVNDIGWVKKMRDGLSRDIFAAEVELADGRCEAYVVALPRADAEPDLDERTSRELRLIARLRTWSFPFRLPEMVGSIVAWTACSRRTASTAAARSLPITFACTSCAWWRGGIAMPFGHGGHPPAHEIDRMRGLLGRLR